MERPSNTMSPPVATISDVLLEVAVQVRGRPGASTKWNAFLTGRTIVESHPNPEFAACRALLACGVTGRVRFVHAATGTIGLTMDIEAGAKLTTEEGDRLRFRTFRSVQSVDTSGKGAAPSRETASAGIHLPETVRASPRDTLPGRRAA